MITAIILQARMGSTRLPGKTLKTICGKTILQLMIERLKHSKTIDEIIVATTESKNDDTIEEASRDVGIKCFRGSEEDVLSRYYHAAKKHNVMLTDLLPDFKGLDPPSLWVSPGDPHPNERAHFILASGIYNRIKNSVFLLHHQQRNEAL